MDSTALVALLRTTLPDAELELSTSLDLQTTVYTSAADLEAVLRTLRDHPELRFSLLSEITATDYWPRVPRFELTYILVSIEHRLRVRLKVRLADEHATAPTAIGLWPAANWLEREVWDMFGIVFDGHPDLRRLLMPEDWEGFPLRKDSPVQIRMKPVTTEPMQVTAEEFRASVEKDRLARG
jgi:NADH-quinone oxidoreductase subunit C